MDTPTIIHVNANEIDDTDDNNDGIVLSITTIPQGQNNLHPLILHVSLDEEQAEGDDDDKNDQDNNDDKEDDNEAIIDHAAHDNTVEGVAEAEDQTEEQHESGVHRSRRSNRGTNKKYTDYTLMMNTRKQARHRKRAIIKDGFTFF